MIASKLIIGGDSSQQETKINQLINSLYGFKTQEGLLNLQKSPDYFLYQENDSFGIDKLRDIIQQLSLKPFFYPFKTVVIKNAINMTIPAQNAFLKTLEEPPPFCFLVLTSNKVSDLLPTLVSRCQLFFLPNSKTDQFSQIELDSFLKTSEVLWQSALGKKFALAQVEGKNKETAIVLLTKLTISLRQLLLQRFEVQKEKNMLKDISKTTQEIIAILNETEKTKRFIEANVNPRFALENLFLKC